ncbi:MULTISPECIES: Tat pathway signal sequence domain protein [unclassified Caulobacter]|uniref:Tat pathway signal sequence domain protein n=1 Tax=unclassified Caulobacter TaxID=2648921 RepID=UPI000D39F876|nr:MULTISPECIES: Tat pathway signal sequence domain protein [unclassified Caulobacter]PTS90836.1 Tat pathway signal sequence domain protein [Caulobacter sp. HMWF009]PTT09661.1 Tat pathway signal sequence domain protein [Caulobacter sp. HMWF025]
MRRNLTLALSALMAVSLAATAMSANAQSRGRGDQGGGAGGDEEQAGKKKKRDEEWNQPKAPLPQLRNAGPCPYVKVLYDASRYVEFKDGRESPTTVGYTGEIQGISSGCAYKSDDPISMRMEILFQLGRGPQATDSHRTYRYWVAVTERNQAVIAKEYFDLPITFPAGQDRVFATEVLNTITIPRADAKVSGGNFEVLVGFDVTPEMAAFNRDGKRFRVNAGQTAQAGQPGTTTKQ